MPEVAVSETIKVPEEPNVCVGFCSVETLLDPEEGSPKFHDQLTTESPLAVDISVNEVSVFKQEVVELKPEVIDIGSDATVISNNSWQPFPSVTVTV
jgi:hypothetical protein